MEFKLSKELIWFYQSNKFINQFHYFEHYYEQIFWMLLLLPPKLGEVDINIEIVV